MIMNNQNRNNLLPLGEAGRGSVRVGILGAAGYTGGELIRLLLNHPEAEIVFANSESNAGNLVSDVHEGLIGETDLKFTDEMPFDKVDVVFFCFGHGKSEQFLKEHTIPENVKIIDLAQDFRIKRQPHSDPPKGREAITPQPSQGEGETSSSVLPHGGVREGSFIYGLPEINKEDIAQAQHVANPGCFATCIQVALLPAANMNLLKEDVAVNAITGSTGAGQKPGATTHFSWRNNNLSIYKPFTHQHLAEIYQSLNQVAQSSLPLGGDGEGSVSIDFIPYRGDFARGIFCTAVIKTPALVEDVIEGYKEFYADAAFTHYSDKPIDLKQVVNTNKALVHVEKYGNKLLVTSAIDNLLKGAVGQAVQNMNLMFGIDETAGLRLKASAF
jgi:N-acetyl-gamma-glutamyl-phosphate reductase